MGTPVYTELCAHLCWVHTCMCTPAHTHLPVHTHTCMCMPAWCTHLYPLRHPCVPPLCPTPVSHPPVSHTCVTHTSQCPGTLRAGSDPSLPSSSCPTKPCPPGGATQLNCPGCDTFQKVPVDPLQHLARVLQGATARCEPRANSAEGWWHCVQSLCPKKTNSRPQSPGSGQLGQGFGLLPFPGCVGERRCSIKLVIGS